MIPRTNIEARQMLLSSTITTLRRQRENLEDSIAGPIQENPAHYTKKSVIRKTS